MKGLVANGLKSPQSHILRNVWVLTLTLAPAAVCNVLYGARLGLLQDFIDPEAQKFIDAVTMMFHTTSPMLYIPPSMLCRINSKTWRDHVQAWDVIFRHGESSCALLHRSHPA